MRYKNENTKKRNGIVYTPEEMAFFLAKKIVSNHDDNYDDSISILDPAVGSGELLIAIGKVLKDKYPEKKLIFVGYETDSCVANETEVLLRSLFDNCEITIHNRDYLSESVDFVYDFIIANPPYVRTQVLGSDKAKHIADSMSLTGRVDIYYAFIIYIKPFLKNNGTAGFITSNKFLTIKSGMAVRNFMLENYCIYRIVDFGDTKLFNAAVLPCILIFGQGKTSSPESVFFTSIYETEEKSEQEVKSIFEKIDDEGTYITSDNKTFTFKQGKLSSVEKNSLWTISNPSLVEWLNNVEKNTYCKVADIGKIRVGIKTTADNVFIHEKWEDNLNQIELLRPLITHRNAGQIIPNNSDMWKVLYTHSLDERGKKVAYNIEDFPNAKQYLQMHFEQLSSRTYIKKANRNWYEIWVPQNPKSWSSQKIVFRDISEKPQFWLDLTGAIVNGDCYWIEINPEINDKLIYLALAVLNSTFIEEYYDTKFNTKLYSRKRRYITQYVEQFPIPSTESNEATEIIKLVKEIIAGVGDNTTACYMRRINILVNSIFNS